MDRFGGGGGDSYGIDDNFLFSHSLVRATFVLKSRFWSTLATNEPWVGIPKVAAHLHVSKDTVYRWVDTQGLPAPGVGHLFRFRLSQVDKWVQKRDGDFLATRSPGTRDRESGDEPANG